MKAKDVTESTTLTEFIGKRGPRYDRVYLDDKSMEHWNGTSPLSPAYNDLYAQLVPGQGAAETIEGELLRAISKIIYRHYNDGDIFSPSSFGLIVQAVGRTFNSYDEMADKVVQYVLDKNGQYTINGGIDWLETADYGPEDETDDEDEDDTNWEDEEEMYETDAPVARAKKPLTAKQKMSQVSKEGMIGADSIRGKGPNTYIFRKGFYYRHGGDAKTFANRVSEELTGLGIAHKLVDCGEKWAAFKGGASLASQSHWWAVFTVSDEGIAEAKLTDPDLIRARNKANTDYPNYDKDTAMLKHLQKGVKDGEENEKKNKKEHEKFEKELKDNKKEHEKINKDLKDYKKDHGKVHTDLDKEVDKKADKVSESEGIAPVVSKSDVKSTLKSLGYATIKASGSNGTAKSLGASGIKLYSRSPMDVTSAGTDRAKEKVNEIRSALGKLSGNYTPSSHGISAFDTYIFNAGTKKEFTLVGTASNFPTYLRSANLDPDYQSYYYVVSAKEKSSLSEAAGAESDIANAVVAEVIKLIGEGHTEVSPDVITTKVSAALGKPFMLKDLVAANNSSPALQHYIDSINPSKIKFSTDILTVKNEDPLKEKEKAQSGVANMASRAAGRSRLGENFAPTLQNVASATAQEKEQAQTQFITLANTAKVAKEKALQAKEKFEQLSQKLKTLKDRISSPTGARVQQQQQKTVDFTNNRYGLNEGAPPAERKANRELWDKVNSKGKMPSIDHERYTPMQGLEGPIRLRSGKVVYYDTQAGKYYDRDTDMYLSDEDYMAHDAGSGKMNETKGLQKRVKIVTGTDAGKTGWIRQVKHGLHKGAPKAFYVDLDDGGQADNLPSSALRLVKEPMDEARVKKSVIEQVYDILENGYGPVKFSDGSMRCDTYTASAVTKVFEALSKEETKVKAIAMMETKAGFMKFADFAFKQVSGKVTEETVTEVQAGPIKNHAWLGRQATGPDGKVGTVSRVSREHTFSRMVPFKTEVTLKHEDGTYSSHRLSSVKVAKNVQESTEEHAAYSWRTTKKEDGSYDWSVVKVAYQKPTEVLKSGNEPTRARAGAKAKKAVMVYRRGNVTENLDDAAKEADYNTGHKKGTADKQAGKENNSAECISDRERKGYADGYKSLNENASTHYNSGYDAKKNGKGRQDNPYTEGSEAARQWAQGWTHASDSKPKSKFTNTVNEDEFYPAKDDGGRAESSAKAWTEDEMWALQNNLVDLDGLQDYYIAGLEFYPQDNKYAVKMKAYDPQEKRKYVELNFNIDTGGGTPYPTDVQYDRLYGGSVFLGGFSEQEEFIPGNNVSEGWESGPDEREPDVDRSDWDYDQAMQDKLDAKMMAEPKKASYKLNGRGPNMEPNWDFGLDEFETIEAAKAERDRLMADPSTPNPTMIGIQTINRTLKEWSGQATLPLRSKEDYLAKRKALTDIQQDPDTARDPMLKNEVVRRLMSLQKQWEEMQEKETAIAEDILRLAGLKK